MPRARSPFLLRPSRRRILLGCILLLGGAVVNVVVAWVLVGAPDSWTLGGPSRRTVWVEYAEKEDEAELERARDHLRAPPDWPALSLTSVKRGFGWTVRYGSYGEWGGSLLFRIGSGWPARSMEFAYVDHEPHLTTGPRWRLLRSLSQTVSGSHNRAMGCR